MINLCLETNKGFGIIVKVGEENAKVGSYVEISQVIKKYADGKMDIIVKGIRRFVIVSVSLHDDGYLIANTHPYYDINFEISKKLVEEIYNKFVALINKSELKLDQSFWTSLSHAPIKSFKIAEKTGLTLEQQQELLLIQDESLRLNVLKEHLEKLEKRISESKTIKEIIMRDGFLN